MNAIARILQEQKTLVPMAYWQSKGLPRGGKKTQPNPYKWCKTTIQKILSQQEYCGDVINFKTCSKPFKNKTRFPNSPEIGQYLRMFTNRLLHETTLKRYKRSYPKQSAEHRNLKTARKAYFVICYSAETATASSVTS